MSETLRDLQKRSAALHKQIEPLWKERSEIDSKIFAIKRKARVEKYVGKYFSRGTGDSRWFVYVLKENENNLITFEFCCFEHNVIAQTNYVSEYESNNWKRCRKEVYMRNYAKLLERLDKLSVKGIF